MSQPLKEIQQVLTGKSDTQNKEFLSKIAPGATNTYGVKTPVLNELARKYRSLSFDLAEELWAAGSQEEKIIAIKILEKTGKTDPKRLLRLLKKFSAGIDNWAICDGLGMQFLRSINTTHFDEILALSWQFSRSKNFWQRRLAIVLLEWYTRKTEHHAEIKKLVRSLEKDDEYYVKKAITWINRNFENGK